MTHKDCKEGDYLLVSDDFPVRYIRGRIVRVIDPDPIPASNIHVICTYLSDFNKFGTGYFQFRYLSIPEPTQVLVAKLLGEI